LGEGEGERGRERERDRQREREQKVKSKGVERALFIWVGEKGHHLEGSQASVARSSFCYK
jgi:hypothetical protein